MTKRESKGEKPHHAFKSYSRVTHRSVNRFKLFRPADVTNLTQTSRKTEKYTTLLDLQISLKDFIIQLAKETGRKIRILDSGCGEAKAIDELLSDEELENYIEHISGISLHYFSNVKNVMEKHRQRFHYYSGTTQAVLLKATETHGAFDLIFDVWGAYCYSENKLELLELYYKALKPNGIARVYQGEKDLYIYHNNKKREFSTWASKSFPDIFSYHKGYCPILDDHSLLSIAMKKTRARWMMPRCEVFDSKEKISIGFCGEHTMEELRKGNAIKFSSVVMEELSEQPMELRPLPFSPK